MPLEIYALLYLKLLLSIWAGVWVIVVKKRGRFGRLPANLAGAVAGFIAFIVALTVFPTMPYKTPTISSLSTPAAAVEVVKELRV